MIEQTLYAWLAVTAPGTAGEVIEAIDSMANKGDRALMIAWMALCVLAFYFFSRWVTKQNEAKDLLIQAMNTQIGEVHEKHNQYLQRAAEQFAGIVEKNSSAFLIFAESMGIKPSRLKETRIGSLDERT